ncbi:unnamed protein product, partial [marine sediment metagenome]
MKVIKIDEVPTEPFHGPTPTMGTGGPITTQPIVTKQMGKNYLIQMVNFSKGARNKFHRHTCDQVLIVTAGTGIVATEQRKVSVGAGDIIHISAGEKHRHGAT